MNDTPDPFAPASAPEQGAGDAVQTSPRPARKRRAPAAEPGGTDVAETASEATPVVEVLASAAPQRSSGESEAADRDPQRREDSEDGGSGSGEGSPGDSEARRGRRRNRRDRKRRDRSDAAPAQGPGGEPAPLVQAAREQVGALFAEVVSGAFDTEESAPPPPPLPSVDEAVTGAQAPPEDAEQYKRVLAPESDAPKLHKVLAQAGVGSRRDMEEMIEDGRITVNGEPAHVGQRISFGDQIKVNGKPVKVRITPPPARLVAYHKPVGEIVTHDDPQNRPTVYRRLPRLAQGKWLSIGRLDINTEGLLLFTNSGELAHQMMHPRFGVEREYAVRVLGTLEPEARARLLAGVEIEGQMAAFRSIEDGGGEGANRWYRVVIAEGRNREVRKLFDAVGLTVSRLIRIRYGNVVLPHGLKRGLWVDLDENEVRAVRRLASGGRADAGRGDGRPARQRDDRGPGAPDRQRDTQRDAQRGRPGPGRAEPQFRDSERAPAGDERPTDFDDADTDFDPRNIPNPLEQTFDKRFVQNPRSPAGGRGFGRGGGGFGAGGSAPPPASPRRGSGPKEPDPLQTSLGYIGADAYHRKSKGGRGGGGGGRRGR